MCRAIKSLHNFVPPGTEDEIRPSSLPFARKLSGFARPSKANEAAFDRSADEAARAAGKFLDSLVTKAPPRDEEVEASRSPARGWPPDSGVPRRRAGRA
jgi:hypothetical protein